MHIRYAALLLCLSCATPSATYERGTLARPPAPARPGVGLPQPRLPQPHVVPQVQPNPRPQRKLPPQRGPGIWASDEPPGRNEPVPSIRVLEVEIPLPPEAKTAWDADMASRCAYIMDLGVRTHAVAQAELARRPESTRCVVALAFHFCALTLGDRAKAMWNTHERDGAITELGRRARDMIEPICATSAAFVARECGVPPPAWVRVLSPAFYEMMHTNVPRVKQ